MDVQQITLTANERLRLSVPGRFFMLVEAGGPVDIGFELGRRTLNEVGRGVEAGYARFPGNWADRDEGRFDAVVMTSATTQTVRIGISDTAADYRRTVGIVEVVGSTRAGTDPDMTVTSGATKTLVAKDLNLIGGTIVQNVEDPGGGVVRVHCGTPGVAASNRGMRLRPGQSVSFASADKVTARAETVDVKVAVTRLLRS